MDEEPAKDGETPKAEQKADEAVPSPRESPSRRSSKPNTEKSNRESRAQSVTDAEVAASEEPPTSPGGRTPDAKTSAGPASVAQLSEAPFSQEKLSEEERDSKSPSVKKSETSKSKVISEASKTTTPTEKDKSNLEVAEDVPPSEAAPKKKAAARSDGSGFVSSFAGGFPNFENFSCSKFLAKRSPFVHNPPQPEERRPRFERPRSPREYIINLREDLADFQESHGLPRTRDYSFMSLGLALAQETARAICSVFLMFSELFPVIAIISLVLRFALDKLIDILETNEPVVKLKKSLIFCLQMVMILIPLWILIGTIVLPLAGLLLSIFRKLLRFKGGRGTCSPPKKQAIAPTGKK